jgi:hypothetical protein
MTEADVTTPAAAASIIPMLTPREIPKSSALMMSRFVLGVDPTRTIPTDAYQIHHHLSSMPGKRNRAWLVAIVKVDRNLIDLHAVQTRDEETLEIEPEAAYSLARKDHLRRPGRESLQPSLRVQDSREKNLLRQFVEQSAHHVPRVEIVKKSRTHHIA